MSAQGSVEEGVPPEVGQPVQPAESTEPHETEHQQQQQQQQQQQLDQADDGVVAQANARVDVLEDSPLDVIEELEVLIAVCDCLDDVKDLGRLACASSSFGRAIEWPGAHGGASELRSVVEESARRWVLVRHQQQEFTTRGGSKPQSWLRRKYDVQLRETVVLQNFQTTLPHRQTEVLNGGTTIHVPGSSYRAGTTILSTVAPRFGIMVWKMRLDKGRGKIGVAATQSHRGDRDRPTIWTNYDLPRSNDRRRKATSSFWDAAQFNTGSMTLVLDVFGGQLAWTTPEGVTRSTKLPTDSMGVQPVVPDPQIVQQLVEIGGGTWSENGATHAAVAAANNLEAAIQWLFDHAEVDRLEGATQSATLPTESDTFEWRACVAGSHDSTISSVIVDETEQER